MAQIKVAGRLDIIAERDHIDNGFAHAKADR
jgi:hypothetical protein